MSTKIDDRLDEMHDRIDRLEAKTQAAAGAKEAMKRQTDALRQHEASARGAMREVHSAQAEKAAERSEAAEARLRRLETRLDAAEHALAAELADNKEAFTERMHAYQEDITGLSDELDDKAATMVGSARDEAEAAISDIRRRTETLAERVAQLREVPGDRWRESKEAVGAARAELELKVDEALEKFN